MSEDIKTMRNVAFAGHGGAGKTTLAEAMLFKVGVTNRLGKVEEGNTVMDFQPEEIKSSRASTPHLSSTPITNTPLH